MPIIATWPGLLSVGTLVCEIPNAPRPVAIDLRYGAIISVEFSIPENAFKLKRRSPRNPSPNSFLRN